MRERTKVGVGIGIGLVGLALAVVGRGAREVEPTTAARAQERRSATGTGTGESDTGRPIAGPWRRTALASVHAAPALGLDDLGDESGGATSVAVDPFTGLATVWEQDAPSLRRARTLGDGTSGLFGRGWRAEVEAELRRDGDGFVVVRIDGLTRLRPAGRGVWLSELGELQALVATKDGFEVDDPAGRLHRFDRDGRLVEIVGELAVERSPGALRLVGRTGAITLELDERGRAARARGPGVDVRYGYEGDELARVEGTARRTYRARIARSTQGGFAADGLEVAGPTGPLLVAALDPRGCVASLEAPGRGAGFVQTYAFSAGAAQMSGPLGLWRYEAEGDGWRITTPTGPERATLDARGRVVSLSRAGGPAEPVARHDALERALRREAPPAPAQEPGVTRARDAAGYVVAEVGPAGRTTFERDAAGRVRARTDGAGRTIRAIRDRAGRVESISGDEGSEVAFELDLAGRPTRAVAGDHALRFEWDRLGRPLAEAGPDARLSWSRAPQVEELHTPWGAFTRRTDAAGRVVALDSPAGTFRWDHDAQGRVRGLRAPNGVVTELTRDAAGRETRRSARGRGGLPILELLTTRGLDGRATELRRDGQPIVLERDARGRLTCAVGAGVALAYGATTERLERDGAGRLLRRGETRYGWDDLGRLVSVTRGDETVRYAYDGLGRLASRTTSAGTTRYVHADGQLLAELGPGERARVWIHGPGLDAPLAYGDGPAGEVSSWTFLHGDATETTLAYTDAAGRRVAQAVVGPFGEAARGPGGDRPVLFAGRPVDPGTGLVHLRARWYSPELGQFLDADPLGPDGGSDPWSYCDGDPVERRDPLGLSPDEPPPPPSAWQRLTSGLASAASSVANSGVDLAGRLVDRGRTAVASVIEREQAGTRDLQVALTRVGVIDPPGRAPPTYSEWTLVNLAKDGLSSLANTALDARQGALAIVHDVVAPDARKTGAARAAADQQYRTGIELGDAFRREQDHSVKVVDLLMEDGHDPLSAAAQTALLAVGDHLLPVTKTREAIVGEDLRHFVDTGDERQLSTQERVQRGLEAASDWAALGAGALAGRAARAAKAAEEAAVAARAAEEAAEAARLARAAEETAEARRAARTAGEAGETRGAARTAEPAASSEPNKGLAQALDPEAERGAAAARGAAEALEPDCVYVLDRQGKPVRIGNYLEDPKGVLDYLKRNPTSEVLVSNPEEAQALKKALRTEPGLPRRPRVFAGEDVEGAMNNFEANAARRGPPVARRPSGAEGMSNARRAELEERVRTGRHDEHGGKHLRGRGSEAQAQAESLRSRSGKQASQYSPGTDVRAVEREALDAGVHGQPGATITRDTAADTHVIYDTGRQVGWDGGEAATWVRAEMSADGTIHSHPLTAENAAKEIDAARKGLHGEFGY